MEITLKNKIKIKPPKVPVSVTVDASGKKQTIGIEQLEDSQLEKIGLAFTASLKAKAQEIRAKGSVNARAKKKT